jgi:hypothetical protein
MHSTRSIASGGNQATTWVPGRKPELGRMLAALLGLAALPVHADSLRLTVRDADSGQFLDAALELAGTDQVSTRLDIAGGRLQWQSQGDLSVRLRAPGHQPLTTQISAGSNDVLLWLDPVSRPLLEAPALPQGTLLQGHVYDFQRGAAVAAARVEVAGVATLTDAHGHFRVELGPTAGDQGMLTDLMVHAAGLPPWRQQVRLTSGASHRIIDLGAGEPGPDHRFDSRQLTSPVNAATPAHAPVLSVPSTIRVGFADAGFTTPCCVGSCSAVSVMSLETYVRRGLNDEWIASWTADSLRAGAIAYRSYGAWHVANPRTGTYDICSSACCQVNDPDTSASSNAAVDATAGILLTDGSSAFRAEYSAENNAWDDPGDGLPCSNADLSCGDGFVGSPAAGWPCLADAVATGHGCFGHGRGMSQWGSQRWALNQGQRWPWIVDHYYNANGAGSGLRTAQLSSPLRIDQFSAPASAGPGQLITLNLDLSNLAGQAHDPVYIGASLFRTGNGFVSDPAHDLGVRLESGAQQRSRNFQLPANLSAGVWDVLVALYLDIDGNGAINSGDLALTSARQNGVLTIVDGPLFVNGFE